MANRIHPPSGVPRPGALGFAVMLTTAASHFGGSLVRGDDFFLKF